MAPTPLPVHNFNEKVPIAPVTEIAADAVNGNSVVNGPSVYLTATNGGGSSATISVAYASTVDGQTIPPRQYTLAAAAKLILGSFPETLFGNPVKITASAATVTLAAYQIG